MTTNTHKTLEVAFCGFLYQFHYVANIFQRIFWPSTRHVQNHRLRRHEVPKQITERFLA